MGVGASAVGTALSTTGAYSAAQSQRSALTYQASVSRSNAALVASQASDALNQGAAQEQNSDLRTAQLYSSQRANMAANGVDLGSGSANDVLTTTAYMGGKDAAQIHTNALLQAWGYQTQATNLLDDANRQSSAASAISPFLQAGTSLLTGASSVAKNWDSQASANGTPNFSSTVSGWFK